MPVLATCFPVPSPSSQGRVSRVRWQDLARVWGGKGIGEEMTTLNPWPSVLPLSALYTQEPSFAWAQRAPLPRRRHQEMSPSLGATVGKPLPQGISWAKACGVVNDAGPRALHKPPEVAKTKRRTTGLNCTSQAVKRELFLTLTNQQEKQALAICQHHHPLEKWRPNCSEASSSTGQQAGRLETVRARAGGGREGIPVSK